MIGFSIHLLEEAIDKQQPFAWEGALMNRFLSGDGYLETVKATIAKAKKIDAAIAFWGAGADAFFKVEGPVRVVCNLLSGGTNPSVIQGLRSIRATVHHSDTLHAKVIFTESVAIIGSANFSTNGLHYEGDELNGWQEAGILTDDPAVLADLAVWFTKLWNSSSEVGDDDLRAAESAWDRSRSTRPAGPPEPFSQLRKADLLDRRISLVIWRHPPSDAAVQTFRSVVEEAARNGLNTQELDFYEGWQSLPQETYLIDVEAGSRRRIHVGSLYERLPRLDPDNGSIQIVQRISEPENCPFVYDAAFRDALARHLKQTYLALLDGNDHREVSLAEALS